MKRTFTSNTKLNGKWASWFLELNKSHDNDGRIYLTFQLFQDKLIVHKVYPLKESNCEKVYDLFYDFICNHKESVTLEEIKQFLISYQNIERPL